MALLSPPNIINSRHIAVFQSSKTIPFFRFQDAQRPLYPRRYFAPILCNTVYKVSSHPVNTLTSMYPIDSQRMTILQPSKPIPIFRFQNTRRLTVIYSASLLRIETPQRNFIDFIASTPNSIVQQTRESTLHLPLSLSKRAVFGH